MHHYYGECGLSTSVLVAKHVFTLYPVVPRCTPYPAGSGVDGGGDELTRREIEIEKKTI